MAKRLRCRIRAISIDDSKTINRVKPMVTSKGWKYQVLLDTNQELKRALNVVNVPLYNDSL